MMGTRPSHLRKLRAVEIVVRIESLKAREDRELDLDTVLENAKRIDLFAVKFTDPKEK